MLNEPRLAVRALGQSPGLSAVIVLSLALGTGANAAVYSAMDALLFRGPAGVVAPSSLVDLYTSQITGASYGDSSLPDFQSIAAAETGLAAVAAIEDRDEIAVRRGTNAALARVAAVTPGLWDLLGLRPLLGDWRAPGVVISAGLWNSLGGDSTIVGGTVTLDGREYPVAAIAPPRFRGLHLDRVFDAWLPLDFTSDRGRGDRRLSIVGRLRPGASLDDVQSRLTALAADLARRYPATNVGTIHSPDEPRRLTALRYSRIDPAARGRAALLGAILLTATVLLLLSACVNAGSLLLSRGLARRAELTIKTALGADRGRLVRAFLIESVLLAVAGAAAGVLAASWTAGAIPALFAPDHAALIDTRVQRGAMAVTLLIGGFAGVVFGLVPALASTRALSPEALRGDASRLGEAPGAARLRMGLVAAQLTLSTVFLVGSVLLSRAVDSALKLNESVEPDSVAVASVEPLDDRFLDAATARLKRIPAVAVIGLAATPPEARALRRVFFIEQGVTREPVEIDVNYVSNDYFRVVHDPILEGRLFSHEDDSPGIEAVVVNEALAQRYFPDRAIGRTLGDASGAPVVRVIGVARTRSYRALGGPPRPTIFFPITRYSARAFSAILRLRGARTQIGTVRAELENAGPTRALVVRTFEDHLSRALATDRLTAALIAACGVLALALAVVGVYGVMADLVRRRTREIGLRLALGAGPVHIVRGVAGSSLGPAVAGIAAGIGAAALLARIARTFVFEVPPADLPTLVLTTVGLAIVVAAAIAPSAIRALRVSPLTALRDL